MDLQWHDAREPQILSPGGWLVCFLGWFVSLVGLFPWLVGGLVGWLVGWFGSLFVVWLLFWELVSVEVHSRMCRVSELLDFKGNLQSDRRFKGDRQ